jgi:hypothetical protein
LLLLHFTFGWWGLRAGYSFDDLMNIGRSIQFPASEQARDVLLFFWPSSVYRPLPELVLRGFYEAFGSNPLPLRILTHGLILANVWAAYRFFRLFVPAGVALAACIPLAHHPGFQLFYASGGFLFDHLCFLFYFVAARSYWTGRWGVFLVFYILALNSKEMAVTLPAVLLLLEFTRRGTWTWKRLSPLIAAALMAGAFILGRVLGPGGVSSIGSYQPDYSLTALGRHLVRFSGEFYLLSAFWPLALLGACAGTRDRAALAGYALAIVGFLPIAFLDRGLEQAYIPAAGLSLLAANLLTRLLRGPAPAFAAMYAWIIVVSSVNVMRPEDGLAESGRIHRVLADIQSMNLQLPRGSRVLFLEDPFPESRHASNLLLFQIARHGEVRVDWVSEGATPQSQPYAAVLTTKGGHVTLVR